jgi:Asp-tRNA(Asn)/Glu-tRNA(Gln) amidotransferase A subunit family amidase
MCIITEGNFEYALEKARECDETRSKTGKQNCTLNEAFEESKHLPWLFGIPISVKDNHNIKGMLTTLGVTAKANNIKDSDCCIVSCAKNSGMIPFIKSNLPQMIITYDSFNFLWGRTLNPWNQNKSAGGSSGG